MSTDTKTKTPVKRKTPDASQVLDRLVRMINRADDFVLGFVKCNHPLQQKQMRQEFLARLSGKRVLQVELDKPLVSLLDELATRWDAENPPHVVCVYGLEKSINELQGASPVLGRLNNDRDLLRRAVPVPLLIWLPDFALDFIARGAPDFWAWRSGVYEFTTEGALWQREGTSAILPNVVELLSLDRHEKRAEIAHLEELLRTAQSLPREGRRERGLIASLLAQRGLMYQCLGRWEEATTAYTESLKIFRAIGDQSGIAGSLHQIATIQYAQGNLEEADHLYRESLEITERLGNQNKSADTLHQLANISYLRGNLEEADYLYRKNLEIEQKIGDIGGVASTLHQLGVLEQNRGNLSEAEFYYRKSLKIGHDIGDKVGIAVTLHQLGMLEQKRGYLTEADRHYHESLNIKRELGNKSGIATTLGQLGLFYQQQGEWRLALQHSVGAWEMFQELHSPYSQPALSDIWNARAHIGEEQFQKWLVEDFGPQAREIRRKLDQGPSIQDDVVQQEPAAIG